MYSVESIFYTFIPHVLRNVVSVKNCTANLTALESRDREREREMNEMFVKVVASDFPLSPRRCFLHSAFLSLSPVCSMKLRCLWKRKAKERRGIFSVIWVRMEKVQKERNSGIPCLLSHETSEPPVVHSDCAWRHWERDRRGSIASA